MSDRTRHEGDSEPPALPLPTRVRLGHGANCSSIGSVLDLLFAGAAIGTAIFAAAAATTKAEAAPEAEEPSDTSGDDPARTDGAP